DFSTAYFRGELCPKKVRESSAPGPVPACPSAKPAEACALESWDAWGTSAQDKRTSMAIRYGCFFSYAHGRHALMQRFKSALADALRCYLEPYFDNEDELFV